MSDVTLDYVVDADELDALPSLEEQQQDVLEPVQASKLPDVYLSDETRTEIELWLGERIDEMLSERQEMADRWEEIEYLYELTEIPEEDRTDFPYEDSARLVIQIIATYTELVWAKLHNTIHAPSDPFVTKPRRPEFIEFYRPLRNFITTLCSSDEMDLESINSSLFMELIKLGTCISKTVYVQEDATRWMYDNVARKYNKVTVRVKDGPDVIHVPNHDFLFPISSKKLEDAKVQAHRIVLDFGEVKRRVRNGVFNLPIENGVEIPLESLKAWASAKRSGAEQRRDTTLGVYSRDDNELEFYEVWFEYALPGRDGDRNSKKEDDGFHDETSAGLPIKLTAWYNTDTRKLLRIQHNSYPLQMTPFDACAMIPRTHRVHGIGIGQMAVATQKEVSTIHNQRLDNATISNANVVFLKDDSLLPVNLHVKPGGTYRVSSPNEVNVVSLGQKYDSTIGEEQHTLSLLERRISVQEYSQEQKTSTSTQAIVNMQELTRKFDAVVRNVRKFESKIIRKVLLLLQQHYPSDKPAMVMGEEDGQFVQRFLDLPANAIEYGIAISVTATTSSSSKELERQAKLSLFNLVTQYYGQLTQYVTQASNPQMPPVVQQTMLRIVDALGELVHEILEDFDIPERDQLTIKLGGGSGAPPIPGASPEAQPPAGPVGQTGDQGNGQFPSLGSVQRAIMASQGAGAT